MSGLQNLQRPTRMLHWGIQRGGDTDPGPVLFDLTAKRTSSIVSGDSAGPKSAARAFNTTGVLGVFRDRDGFPLRKSLSLVDHDPELPIPRRRAPLAFFSSPGLFALNGLAYLIYGLRGAPFFRRDLAPTRFGFGATIGRSHPSDHFKVPTIRAVKAAKRYNGPAEVRLHDRDFSCFCR